MLDHSLFEQMAKGYFLATTPVIDAAMGRRFKMARRDMKLTQVQMAERLGLSQTDICRIESGKMTYAPLTCEKFRIVLEGRFQYVLLTHGYYRYEKIDWRYNKQIKRIVGFPTDD